MSKGGSRQSQFSQTIQEQAEKISVYEKKIKDVVAAYKSLQKEKQALEETVKVLTASTSHETTLHNVSSPPANHDLTTSPVDSPDHPDTAGETGEDSAAAVVACSQCAALRHQLSTLTGTIATLTDEKNRMDACYQADKRALKANLENELQQLRMEVKNGIQMREELQTRLHDTQRQLTDERGRRDLFDSDKNNQVFQLKKLISKITDEKETLEEELLEIRVKNEDMSHKLLQLEESKEVQRTQRELQLCQDLASVQAQLHQCQRDLDTGRQLLVAKSEQVQKCLVDLHACKAFHSKLDEQWSAERTRLLLDRATREEELESRISELSQLLGDAEQQRLTDNAAYQLLKEKHLLLEAAVLDKDKSQHPDNESQFVDREVDLLKDTKVEKVFVDDEEELQHLWSLLGRICQKVQHVNSRMKEPHTLDGVLHILLQIETAPLTVEEAVKLHQAGTAPLPSPHSSSSSQLHSAELLSSSSSLGSHLSCCHQVKQLTAQLQKVTSQQEQEQANRSLMQLRQRIQELQEELRQTEKIQSDALHKLRVKIKDMEDSHRNEVLTIRQNYDATVSEAQRDLQAHRNRTLQLMEDKDREILYLQNHLPAVHNTATPGHNHPDGERKIQLEEAEEEDNLCLWNSSPSKPLNGILQQCSLIHCVEEKSRKDSEIARLRSEKHQLEQTLRTVKQQVMELETEHATRVRELKNLIHQERQSRHRDTSTNNEYVRNVVFRYLSLRQPTSTDRANILRAIASALNFDSKQWAEIDHLFH